jgi:GAF domain-containing protein
MKAAPETFDEPERLSALRSYEILDSLEEAQFDALTRLAASICDVPISLVSLVDEHRQWFKSVVGLPQGIHETPRSVAFCAHAIHGKALFEVPDALIDERFHDNPLVTGAPNVRLLRGHAIGRRARIRVGNAVCDRSCPEKARRWTTQRAG